MEGDGYVKFDCENYFIMCVCVYIYKSDISQLYTIYKVFKLCIYVFSI